MSLQNFRELLNPSDLRFLQRVYVGGLERYQRRLAQIGFEKQRSILDAGCGFGQWTLAMAQTCQQVTGIDVSFSRVSLSRHLAQANNVSNISFLQGRLEDTPFSESTFDAILSYSVLYLTNFERAFSEFQRILKPGGMVYICTNGPGRFLYEVLHNPNPTTDFSPRWYALKTFLNTILGKRDGLSAKAGAHFMTIRKTVKLLQALGFEIIASGGEGTIVLYEGDRNEPVCFYNTTYMGLENVFEIIARKMR